MGSKRIRYEERGEVRSLPLRLRQQTNDKMELPWGTQAICQAPQKWCSDICFVHHANLVLREEQQKNEPDLTPIYQDQYTLPLCKLLIEHEVQVYTADTGYAALSAGETVILWLYTFVLANHIFLLPTPRHYGVEHCTINALPWIIPQSKYCKH